MIKLRINKEDMINRTGTLGLNYTFDALTNSGLFEIDYHNETVNAMRGFRSSIVFVNNKKILIDFWEYASPAFTSEVIKANFDLVVKLQAKDMTFEHMQNFCARKQLFPDISTDDRKAFLNKVVPLSFFPSKMFFPYVGRENELKELSEESFGFFCGKWWKCRRDIAGFLSKSGVEVIFSDRETQKGFISDDEYLRKMQSSKFGIVLGGRSTALTDPKNRREVDYMMLKKPLLINYKPYYYNSFIEGKHFIYLDDKVDLTKLETSYNLKEIGANGYQWYLDNVHPQGLAKTFVKIMTERGII